MSDHRTVEVCEVWRKFSPGRAWYGADLRFSGSYGARPSREGAIAAFSALVHPVAWQRDHIDARPIPGSDTGHEFVGGRTTSDGWRVTIRRESAE